MQRPAAFIFDLGDTIITGDEFNTAAGSRRMLELAGNPIRVTVNALEEKADLLFGEALARREEVMLEIPFQNLQRLLYETMGLTFSATAAQLEIEYWDAITNYQPAEGIEELLSFLEHHRIRRGILSNTIFSSGVLEYELKKHKLAHWFEFIIATADYGFRKPHANIYNLALAKLQLPPEQIWFAGDKLAYDVAGARGVGMQALWYNPGKLKEEHNFDCLELSSWPELQCILEKEWAGSHTGAADI